MKIGLRAWAVCIVLFAAPCWAWNTCGESGSWKRRLIPDQWGKAHFSPACNNHDDCYDTCGRSKHECDKNFHSELRDACKKAYSANFRPPCYWIIDTYHSGVHRMGGDAYRRAQKAKHCR